MNYRDYVIRSFVSGTSIVRPDGTGFDFPESVELEQVTQAIDTEIASRDADSRDADSRDAEYDFGRGGSDREDFCRGT